jgi:hypothetical protein
MVDTERVPPSFAEEYEADGGYEVNAIQCHSCRHWHPGTSPPTCTAFENGIPHQIWLGQHDHTQRFKGDGGTRYEPADAFVGVIR